MQNSRNLRALLKSSSLALALTIGVATGAEAGNPWEIISIDAATTTVISINGSSTILGKFFRADGIQHGFLQAPDGTVTTFDDPDAANATIPTAMSANGTVAGYLDNGAHGFIRDPKGNIQTFDVPGTVGSTVARAINVQGTVIGDFQDGPITTRGFLRAADGTFETFAPPDATFVAPVAINGHGTIAGVFNDSHGSEHAFVRNRLGRITVFDVPGATFTYATGMNAAGEIVGGTDKNGFLREPDGTITTIDPSGSDFKGVQNSVVTSINYQGVITGCYWDKLSIVHGWVRNPSGTYFALDAPGATNTCTAMIAPNGRIIGNADNTVGFRLNRRGWDNAN